MNLPSPITRSRARHLATSVAFLAVLWLPMVDQLCDLDPSAAIDERRILDTFPSFPSRLDKVGVWTGKVSRALRDHVGFRRLLVRGYSRMMTGVFGVSGNKDVVLGTDGWLFKVGKKGPLQGHIDRDFAPRMRSNLDKMEGVARGAAVPYLLVVAPGTAVIHPENVPWHARPIWPQGGWEKLMEHLEVGRRDSVIDLSKELIAAKARKPVYFKADPHWNEEGARVAVETILARLRQLAPHKVQWVPRTFRMDEHRIRGQQVLARMINMGEDYEDLKMVAYPNDGKPAAQAGPGLILSLTPNLSRVNEAGFRLICTEGQQGVIVCFGDSFAEPLVVLLSHHCSKLILLKCHANAPLLEWVLKEFSPDAVIDVVAHYNLLDGSWPMDPGATLVSKPSPELLAKFNELLGLFRGRQYSKALVLAEEISGWAEQSIPKHRAYVDFITVLGLSRYLEGQLESGRTALARALALTQWHYGANSVEVAQYHKYVFEAAFNRRQREEALYNCQRAIDIMERQDEPNETFISECRALLKKI